MNAQATGLDALREELAAELSDAALETASRYGVQGASVDQEVDFWRALGHVVRVGVERPRPASACREELAAELADAAYRVALAHGFRNAFVDVRLGLWKAVRRVLRTGRAARRFFRALPAADEPCLQAALA